MTNHVKRLAEHWDALSSSSQVQRLRNKSGEALYSLHVGTDIRVLFVLRDDFLVVVDIVRTGQIEKLRSRMPG